MSPEQSGRPFDVVTQAVIESQSWGKLPRVLGKDAERGHIKQAIGAADTLNEILRKAQSIRLYSSDPWAVQRLALGEESAGVQRAEIVNAAIIQLKDLVGGRTDQDVIGVLAKFESVLSLDPGQVIDDLVALLDAVHRRKRFPAEECRSRNVDPNVASTWQLRKTVFQAKPSELIA